MLALVVSGCGLEIPRPSYVATTELLTVRHSVVELAPRGIARIGPVFADQPPIAEVLPGDRLRLEAIVVDPEGRVLAEDEIETLWVQCGHSSCDSDELSSDYTFNYRCAELPSSDMGWSCVLGTGTGTFEFVVPELGLYSLLIPPASSEFIGVSIRLLGVVAWGGRSAEACWAARRGEQPDLERCEFIYRDVKVGPYGSMLLYGAERDFPLPEEFAGLPEIVLMQPANRIPKTPTLSVLVDGELRAQGVPPLPTIPVEPGSLIAVELAFDPVSQLLQGHYQALAGSSDAFILRPERVVSRTATTGAITRAGPFDPSNGPELPVQGDGRFDYEVDADASPGRSKIFIVYRDTFVATDWLSLSFEVQ